MQNNFNIFSLSVNIFRLNQDDMEDQQPYSTHAKNAFLNSPAACLKVGFWGPLGTADPHKHLLHNELQIKNVPKGRK